MEHIALTYKFVRYGINPLLKILIQSTKCMKQETNDLLYVFVIFSFPYYVSVIKGVF